MGRRKRLIALVAGGAFLAGGTALAVQKGGTLYIKARNTKVMSAASPTANVLGTLQPGDQVTWDGPDTGDKKWQHISKNGHQGLVFVSDLSETPPSKEMISAQGDKPIDAKAFASSGAATKALAEGAANYGNEKGMTESVNQLKALESLAKGVSVNEAAAHAKQAGLFPVVGEDKK